MAAELPYASDPNHKPAAPATTRRWSTVALFVFLAVSLPLCVRRVHGDSGAVAFVGVSHLNMALFVCAIRRLEVAPQGSPARRARLAVWLLSTTLTATLVWKITEVVPLGGAAVAWAAAAVSTARGFYVLFLRGDEKPSESLIV